MRTALLLLASLATSVGVAHAADAREVTLNDGRVYIGEVLTTEPAGVRLRVPQGEIVVPFHQLQNMAPASPGAFEAQRVWEVVVVGADEPRLWVERAVRTIPKVAIAGDQGVRFPLSPAAARTARECPPSNLGCAVRAAARDELWTWLITVEPNDRGGAIFRGATSFDSGTTSVDVKNLYDAAEVLSALDRIMGLRAVDDRQAAIARLAATAPKGVTVAKAPKGPSATQGPSEGALDAFVPLPGYTALRQGDMRGFGLGLAVAVPTTAAWVGLTGSQSQSAPEHAALSVGGYYLTTVLVNQVLGVSGSGAKVGIAPLPGARGAQVGVSVPLR